MKKIKSIVGVILVAVFMVSGLALAVNTNTASAGTYNYGGTNSGHKHHKKHKKHKKKKASQATVRKKIAEFRGFNTPQSIAAYNRVSAIKKANPAQFRNLQRIFNQYNRVGGKLKVRPSVQTVSAINMFRSYNGYGMYVKYMGKLKK